ncbi:MAG: hypothetical protein ACI9FD_002084, partial [Gammaproteobacteria bacterium]
SIVHFHSSFEPIPDGVLHHLFLQRSQQRLFTHAA